MAAPKSVHVDRAEGGADLDMNYTFNSTNYNHTLKSSSSSDTAILDSPTSDQAPPPYNDLPPKSPASNLNMVDNNDLDVSRQGGNASGNATVDIRGHGAVLGLAFGRLVDANPRASTCWIVVIILILTGLFTVIVLLIWFGHLGQTLLQT